MTAHFPFSNTATETIDYGACAFMDMYDPATVFSSIERPGAKPDESGPAEGVLAQPWERIYRAGVCRRYAYGNQPRIAHRNLSRFAETTLPLLADEEAQAR
jgi:uncharacterized protein YdiU (UPF0061 family)